MKALKFFIITFACINPLFAQNKFDDAIKEKMNAFVNEDLLFPRHANVLLPSNNLQSITTPSGWGGGNVGYFFFSLGGIFPALYHDPQTPDMLATTGLSFGDPVKFINISASLNVARVSEFRDLSANILLSKQIFSGSSISAGGFQLFASKTVSDAPDPTFYIAFSHAVQSVKSKVDGYSALGYTIGFGTGRFLHKSPDDVSSGKGRFGTGVFASVSYEVINRLNLNAEWSGLNLGFSLGVRPLKQSAITFGFGIENLTKYSGDRITYMALLGVPVFFKVNKERVY